jgi:hypothetical protein
MAPPENPTAPSEPAQPLPTKSKEKKKFEKKDDDLVSAPMPSPCAMPKRKLSC